VRLLGHGHEVLDPAEFHRRRLTRLSPKVAGTRPK